MKVTISEQINAPREDVFNVFADFQHIQERIDGITKVEFTKGDPSDPAPGLTWLETRKVFGKDVTEEMWLTEIEPSRRYLVESDSQGTAYRSEYIFTESENGTTVSMTFGGKPVSTKAKLMYPMSFLFAPSMKKMMRQDILDLKQTLEA